MNIYTVKTYCETYGLFEKTEKANTPFDAAEKAKLKMRQRHKEDIIKQEVQIMDGSKKKWNFEKGGM